MTPAEFALKTTLEKQADGARNKTQDSQTGGDWGRRSHGSTDGTLAGSSLDDNAAGDLLIETRTGVPAPASRLLERLLFARIVWSSVRSNRALPGGSHGRLRQRSIRTSRCLPPEWGGRQKATGWVR